MVNIIIILDALLDTAGTLDAKILALTLAVLDIIGVLDDKIIDIRLASSDFGVHRTCSIMTRAKVRTGRAAMIPNANAPILGLLFGRLLMSA